MLNNVGLNRRKFIGGAIASVFAATTLSTTALAQDSDVMSEQVKIAMAYRQASAPTQSQAILDKVNNRLYLVSQSGDVIHNINVLTGNLKRDDLDEVNAQGGVTPAGHFAGIEVAYQPFLDPQKYEGQIAINFIERPDGSRAIALHSTLNTTSNEDNIADNNAQNNNVSNGCIRISRDKDWGNVFLFFATSGQGGYASFNDFQSKVKVEKQQPDNAQAEVVMKSQVRLVVLPEQDVSRANTLRYIQQPSEKSLDIGMIAAP